MSQKKTVIQGLEPNPNVGKKQQSEPTGFYARNNRSVKSRGTIVPGMMDYQQSAADEATQMPRQQQPKARPVATGKPVVGFLYSVSRVASGEFWPVCIGRNVIGKNADADICLAEATVSDNHAILVVRQLKNTGGVVAAIGDKLSTNGTLVNGEPTPIDGGALECHDGDIITIGNNYELVFVLIDVAKLGLSVSPGFIPVDTASDDDDDEEAADDEAPFFGGAAKTQPGTGFSPYGNAPWGSEPGAAPAGGTVGMDGQVTGGGHGGTVSM